jgi:hypothetical protein
MADAFGGSGGPKRPRDGLLGEGPDHGGKCRCCKRQFAVLKDMRTNQPVDRSEDGDCGLCQEGSTHFQLSTKELAEKTAQSKAFLRILHEALLVMQGVSAKTFLGEDFMKDTAVSPLP